MTAHGSQRVLSEIVRARPGVRPGVLMADTVELTATVESVDLPNHEATLHISDGRAGTFKVRKDVDLTQVKPGAKVFIHIASAAAIMLEKPQPKQQRLNRKPDSSFEFSVL